MINYHKPNRIFFSPSLLLLLLFMLSLKKIDCNHLDGLHGESLHGKFNMIDLRDCMKVLAHDQQQTLENELRNRYLHSLKDCNKIENTVCEAKLEKNGYSPSDLSALKSTRPYTQLSSPLFQNFTSFWPEFIKNDTNRPENFVSSLDFDQLIDACVYKCCTRARRLDLDSNPTQILENYNLMMLTECFTFHTLKMIEFQRKEIILLILNMLSFDCENFALLKTNALDTSSAPPSTPSSASPSSSSSSSSVTASLTPSPFPPPPSFSTLSSSDSSLPSQPSPQLSHSLPSHHSKAFHLPRTAQNPKEPLQPPSSLPAQPQASPITELPSSSPSLDTKPTDTKE